MRRSVAPERQAEIFAALADPVRVRFVRELSDGHERSGSAIAGRLGISLALLCHHSKILVGAGLVQKRKEAQTSYYRASGDVLKECVRGLLLLVLVISMATVTAAAQQRSTQPPPPPSPSAPPSPAPTVSSSCDYIDPADATRLLGQDVSATTAPSRGALLSCGYTSPGGNALTVSIADYGIPSVAQQFFEKTWETLKAATVEDTLGVSGFAFIAPDQPRASITALKAEKIVTIEASGAAVGNAQALPALRAMLVKLLAKLGQPAPAPAPAPAPVPPAPAKP